MAIWLKDIEIRLLKLLNPLVILLVSLKIYPKILTMSGLVASAVSCYFFAKGSLFWGGIMIIIVGLSDILDGQIARYTGKTSRFGAFLDSTIDRYTEGFVYLGLIIYFWEKSLLVVILIMIAVIGSLLVSYVKVRGEGLGIECLVGLMQRKERLIVLILGSILGSLKYTGNIFLGLAIGIIAVLSHFTVIQRMMYVRRELNRIKK